jgi:steroid 5-alpha reductase family enzyme
VNGPLPLLIHAWLASAVLMLVLWIIQRLRPNASIADVGWCAGLIGAVVWYALMVEGNVARRIVVALMIGLYAARLGTHILFDRIIGKQEDARYRIMRRRWGGHEPALMFA